MDKKITRYVEGYPRHFDAPPREPGSVERRVDFWYMEGHGTFYRFDETHYNESFLNAAQGDRVSLVLYNLNTDQLDEVVFEMDGYQPIGENYLRVTGYIADINDCFRIKIEYYRPDPLESFIKVYVSARPDYDFYYGGGYEKLLNIK